MLRAKLMKRITFELKVVLGDEKSAEPGGHVPDRLVGFDLAPDVRLGQFQSAIDFREQLVQICGSGKGVTCGSENG